MPHEMKVARHHADHRERLTVQFHRAAEHVGSAGKAPLPQVVAEHEDRRAVRATFSRREGSAEQWMNTEQAEEIRRRHHDAHFFRIAGTGTRIGDRATIAAKSRRRGDRAAGFAQLIDVGSAEPAALEIEHRAIVAPDEVQIVRARIRQRIDEYFLNDGRDDAEGAKADDERADHRQGEGGCANEPAHGELRVASPVAGASPCDRGIDPFPNAIHQRIAERAEPHARDAEPATRRRRNGATVEIGFDEPFAHLLTKVGRIELEQQTKPPLGSGYAGSAPHDALAPSNPLDRAARVSASMRCASARATRRPSGLIS